MKPERRMMMKRVKVSKKAKGLVVGAALCAAFGSVQAATVSECRTLVGFNSSYGAWGAVQTSGDYFLSRNRIQQCEVKVVGASASRKPITTTMILEGPMAKDECSMFNYLSSVDSKLNQAKVGEAYVTISAMIAKTGELLASGQLEQFGYDTISTATTAVQSCIAELMSQ